MKKDADISKFFKYTRMTVDQFNPVLQRITLYLQKKGKHALTPELQLVITLRYFITGTHFGDLLVQFRVGTSTIHYIIRRTCDAILKTMMSELSYPTERDYYDIMNKFWSERQMPNCVGAIDGKHVMIQAPPWFGSQYYNYKGYFSVVLLAVCDTDYKFTMVDIGQYGSISDGGVFSDCALGKRILEEEANLPVQKLNLPNSRNSTDVFFVADQAFPLSKRIIRLYPGKLLTKGQQIFNYRLSCARSLIENTFGILTAKWKIFRTPINVTDLQVVDKIILSIVCLHNYLRKANMELKEEEKALLS